MANGNSVKILAKILTSVAVLMLGACANEPPRYGVSVANNIALKAIKASEIGVGTFTRTAEFSNNCRLLYGKVSLPYNMTFESYIQQALSDELEVAGMLDEHKPKIILTGDIEKLGFSTLTSLLGGGSWDITLRVNSSNGKSVTISDHYEFDASGQVWAACAQTASAYMPAVQDLIGKLIVSPDFKALVTPIPVSGKELF